MYTNMDPDLNNKFYFLNIFMIYSCATISIAFFIVSIAFLMEYLFCKIDTEQFKYDIVNLILTNLLFGLISLFFGTIFYFIKTLRLIRNYS
jgi:hypothetical protein